MTSILPFTYSSFKKQTFSTPRWFRKPTSLSHYGFLFHFCLKLHSPEYILLYKFSVLQKFDSSLVDNALLWQTQLVLLCHKLKGWNRSYMRQQQIIAGWFVLTKNYLQNIMHKNVSTIYLIHLRQNAIITFSTCHQLILSKRHNKKLFLISRSKDAVLGVILLWRPQKWPILWPPTPLNV